MKKGMKKKPATTRRKWDRFGPEDIPSLKGIVFSEGNTARVIDICCGGALIETDVRLCPQTKIGFKVMLDQRDFRITGSVLRSAVKSLKDTPIYRSAIAFDQLLTVLVDEITPP